MYKIALVFVPLCYERDVTDEMVDYYKETQAKYGN